MSAINNIYPGRFLDNFAFIFLGESSTYGYLEMRILLFRIYVPSESAVKFLVRIFSNSAGIKDNQVWLFACRNRKIALSFQKAANSLGIMNIHLATMGLHQIGARALNCCTASHV